MSLRPSDLSHERGCLIDVRLIVPTDRVCDFNSRRRRVTNQVLLNAGLGLDLGQRHGGFIRMGVMVRAAISGHPAPVSSLTIDRHATSAASWKLTFNSLA